MAFEDQAFALLNYELADERLGIIPHLAQIYKRKQYFSHARGGDIEFDIAIEVTLPQAREPSFIWLWECKDYARAVPVDDVEEFDAKVQQVTGLNVKGGLITSSAVQSGALKYASSRKIAIVRILPENQVSWLMYLSFTGQPTYVSTDAISALTQQAFHSRNRTNFGASHGRAFALTSDLFKYVLLEEIDGLLPVAGASLQYWAKNRQDYAFVSIR